ncbi:MAG: acylphosphatase, partial [Methanosarcinales archaeon]|nr:acylphosphatase [Methanosarcinales archaeon]
NIQNVGYRAKVIGIAKDFGLTGFIQNLDDGRVRIIAESDNGSFEKFLDAIRIKNTLINVHDIGVEYADATGDFADFYKLVSGGETDERLDTAAEYLKEIIVIMRSGFSEMLANQNETTAEIRGLREAQNVMIEKQNETTAEIRGLREDMKSYMDRKFGEIESELDVIKSALKAKEIL